MRFYAPPPAIFNRGHIVSPLSVRRARPPVLFVPSVSMKNGFRAIAFEKINVLDSYFIHRHISIKYRSNSIQGKIHQIWDLWPFPTWKNGFRSIPFEKISVLNSYFIHRYTNTKYWSSSIKGKNPPIIMVMTLS